MPVDQDHAVDVGNDVFAFFGWLDESWIPSLPRRRIADMPSGLNSPYEVYFFTKAPEDYKAGPDPYFYEIDKVQNEMALDAAKASTKNRALLKEIQFGAPEVGGSTVIASTPLRCCNRSLKLPNTKNNSKHSYCSTGHFDRTGATCPKVLGLLPPAFDDHVRIPSPASTRTYANPLT